MKRTIYFVNKHAEGEFTGVARISLEVRGFKDEHRRELTEALLALLGDTLWVGEHELGEQLDGNDFLVWEG